MDIVYVALPVSRVSPYFLPSPTDTRAKQAASVSQFFSIYKVDSCYGGFIVPKFPALYRRTAGAKLRIFIFILELICKCQNPSSWDTEQIWDESKDLKLNGDRFLYKTCWKGRILSKRFSCSPINCSNFPLSVSLECRKRNVEVRPWKCNSGIQEFKSDFSLSLVCYENMTVIFLN